MWMWVCVCGISISNSKRHRIYEKTLEEIHIQTQTKSNVRTDGRTYGHTQSANQEKSIKFVSTILTWFSILFAFFLCCYCCCFSSSCYCFLCPALCHFISFIRKKWSSMNKTILWIFVREKESVCVTWIYFIICVDLTVAIEWQKYL